MALHPLTSVYIGERSIPPTHYCDTRTAGLIFLDAEGFGNESQPCEIGLAKINYEGKVETCHSFLCPFATSQIRTQFAQKIHGISVAKMRNVQFHQNYQAMYTEIVKFLGGEKHIYVKGLQSNSVDKKALKTIYEKSQHDGSLPTILFHTHFFR